MLALLAPIAFKCMTGFPTTTFKAETQGDQVVVEVVHHNGVKYMPVHRGIVVPGDFAYLEAKAKMLTKMGPKTVFRFPRERCKVYGKGQLSCPGSDTQVFDGTKMTASDLSMSTGTDRTMGFSFDRFTVTLTLQIEGFVPVQEISMDYSDGECELGF